MDEAQKKALADQLAKLRRDYLKRLPADLARLTELSDSLHGGERDRAQFTTLHLHLHKLAGSGGSFGLPALSAAARTLEKRVKNWLAGDLSDVDAATCRAFALELAALATSENALGQSLQTSSPVTKTAMPRLWQAPPNILGKTIRV